jgi:hypothetical protein
MPNPISEIIIVNFQEIVNNFGINSRYQLLTFRELYPENPLNYDIEFTVEGATGSTGETGLYTVNFSIELIHGIFLCKIIINAEGTRSVLFENISINEIDFENIIYDIDNNIDNHIFYLV